MRRLLTLAVIAAAAAFLTVTNPGMRAFQDFARTYAADRIQSEMGGGPLSDLLSGAGGELMAGRVPERTTRTSYLVCSLYTLDLDDDGRPNGRALGIAGQFVVLEKFALEDGG